MYDLLFVGLGASAFGTLLGSWLSFRLTKEFQQSLLDQQLAFNERQAAEDTMFRKQLHDEQLARMKDLHEMLNTKLGRVYT
jgi:hypothetical protein